MVEGSQSISVGGDRSLSVTGKDTENFKGERLIMVAGEDNEYYNNQRKTVVGTLDYGYVDGVKSDVVKGSYQVDVTGPYSLVASEEILAKQGDNRLRLQGNSAALANGKALLTMDGPELQLDADSKITIKVGGSQITINANTIELKSTMIKLTGDQIEISGSTKVKLSGGGSVIELQSGTASMSSATVDIHGTAEVKLNS